MAQGKKLNKREMTDLANMYMQNYTYEQIAEELGISKASVYNNIKNNKELNDIIEDMRDKYASEICDLAVDCMKQVLLNSDKIPKTILVQYLGLAMKYSGMATNSQINVKEEKQISLKDISIDDLLTLKI